MPKFSKNVRWLEPFYEAAEDLLPQGKLKRVTGYTLPKGKDPTCYAACYSYEGKYGSFITIWIQRDAHKRNRLIKRKPATIEEMLYDFAHELAHVPQRHESKEHHPVSHLVLTVRIMGRFIRILNKVQVRSTSARRCKALGKDVKED